MAALTGVAVTTSGWATALGGKWVPLRWYDVGLCALADLDVTGAYTSFVIALRIGEFSFVATYRYADIPMACSSASSSGATYRARGVLPDVALIKGAGLYIVLRERLLVEGSSNRRGEEQGHAIWPTFPPWWRQKRPRSRLVVS